MASYNRVLVLGNLTADPATHDTSGGTPVAEFVVAVDNPRRRRDRRQETAFVLVRVFGRLATAVAQNRKKGDAVLVDGHMITDSWFNTDGKRLWRTYVVGESVQFLPRAVQQGDVPEGLADDTGFDAVDSGVPF